ncbi:hypothetical protein EPA93_43330 [Ktedonosporobacter rubrisoli]|uniref:Type IV secretory system conjugative DNA transfer family protein n=1 Tax=Ktedonosporobacter rubrisoli TaxID=2509675 RepID=A0A4P6K2S2_KTERU|nr:type IV secretory system conjugative DNA transfer family protein [Ktedonosporobacter rubrisoli]QBD82449.1 hypothetical protein EPA93_43330 [Ktedonosporobacter rubrisoli]
MSIEERTKYIAGACIIILLLLLGEIVVLSGLDSPDPLTMLILPSWKTFYIALIVLFAAGIIATCVGLWFILSQEQRSDTYGTAHFATKREVRQAGVVVPVEDTQASYFRLGTYRGMEIGLSEEQSEKHILLVAPTGAGKTSTVIIPNLLRERGRSSLFINDVKHELIDLTIGAISQYHDCYIISPTLPQESNFYNPLAHVKPESLGDARNIAECLIRNSGFSKEPFWDNVVRVLVTSTVLHLKATEPYASFGRVADICTSTLSEIVDLLTRSPSALARRVSSSFVRNVAAEPRLSSNIMTDVATRFFDAIDPGVEAVTSGDDLDFQRLTERPSAIFLHIPPHEATRLKWFSSCLIMQLINYMFENRKDLRFFFYLDELANIGYIPNYLEYISYIRSAGVALIQAIQDFGQLERLYEAHGKDTILANSNHKVFFGGVGQVEAEYVSKVIGDSTVLAHSHSQNKQGVTYSEAARKLMNPDEVRMLPSGSMLVLSGNIPPLKVKAVPYYRSELNSQVGLPFNPINTHRLPSSMPTIIEPVAPDPLVPLSEAETQLLPPIGGARTDEDYFAALDDLEEL